MFAKIDVLLMVKIAQMYYVNYYECEEIARRLDISPVLVSDMLEKAIELGIVDFKIRSVS